MEEIKVSIITVCYNSEKTIRKTIESVLGQTYKKIEYIIVDGNSHDRTMDIVNEYKPSFEGRMKVVSEPDDGIYFAMNKGIKMATGELVGIINSDDWYEEDAVEKIIVKYGENKKDYMVLYGLTGIIKNGEMITELETSHENLENEMISHPSCFITRATYEKYGLYNTKYTSVADYDLMLRYKRSNCVSFIPVHERIANFALGGMSSTGAAYVDLIKLKMSYKKISRIKGYIEIFKSKASLCLEKHGMKFDDNGNE